MTEKAWVPGWAEDGALPARVCGAPEGWGAGVCHHWACATLPGREGDHWGDLSCLLEAHSPHLLQVWLQGPSTAAYPPWGLLKGECLAKCRERDMSVCPTYLSGVGGKPSFPGNFLKWNFLGWGWVGSHIWLLMPKPFRTTVFLGTSSSPHQTITSPPLPCPPVWPRSGRKWGRGLSSADGETLQVHLCQRPHRPNSHVRHPLPYLPSCPALPLVPGPWPHAYEPPTRQHSARRPSSTGRMRRRSGFSGKGKTRPGPYWSRVAQSN